MSAILALPPPSGSSLTTTFGRARALAGSDALPVTPVRAVPDEERRRKLREAQGDGREAVQDESASSSSVREAVGSPRQGTGETGSGEGGGAGSQPVANPIRARSATAAAGDSAGFLAQSLYQQNLGTGLHIEAWDSAITAYRQADGVGVSGGRGRGITV